MSKLAVEMKKFINRSADKAQLTTDQKKKRKREAVPTKSFASHFRDFITLDEESDIFFPHAKSDLVIPDWASKKLPKLKLVGVGFRRSVQKYDGYYPKHHHNWTELEIDGQAIASTGEDLEDREALLQSFMEVFKPTFPSIEHKDWILEERSEDSVVLTCLSYYNKAGRHVDTQTWMAFIEWVKGDNEEATSHVPQEERNEFLRIFAPMLQPI